MHGPTLGEAQRHELAQEIAGLPSERGPERLEAKQFDLLMLNLQLSMLAAAPGFQRLKERVIEIASALEEQSTIPVIREQLVLIEEIPTGAWWQDVTVGMLENARKRLGGLVHLIDRRRHGGCQRLSQATPVAASDRAARCRLLHSLLHSRGVAVRSAHIGH